MFAPGANGRPVEAQITDMKEAGANAAKYWFDWSVVEPRAVRFDNSLRPAEQGSSVTRAILRSRPDLIEEYAFPDSGRFLRLIDWSTSDELIRALNRAGLSPVPLIADATTAPFVESADGSLNRIAPEEPPWTGRTSVPGLTWGYTGVGREAFLGQVLLFTAAAARRYSRGDLRVDLWNTENELNWTYVHVLVAGWRKGDAWLDPSFLLDLLSTLQEGIHLGNPSARATMNLNIADPDWKADARLYLPFMDVIGIGAYPNYIFGEPIQSSQVVDAVDFARSLDKPVMVLETGYPSGPEGHSWTAEKQAEYFRSAAGGACSLDAEGFFYFKLDDEDLPRPDVQAVENHWGLIDIQGKRKPSFDAFRELTRVGCRPKGQPTTTSP